MHQLSAHENLRQVVLCLDNDQAGHVATERITQTLADKGYSVSSLAPAGKDWNEALVSQHQSAAEMEVTEACLLSHT